jgi:uncharacterized protein (DUF885 family)
VTVDGPTAEGAAGPTVTAVADAYVVALAELDPAAARVLGTEPPALLPMLDPASVTARRDLAARTVRSLQGAAAADERERLLRAVLTERLEREVELHDSGFTPGLVAPLASPAHALVQALAGLPDHEALDGLSAVPAALADLRASLEATSAGGYTVPSRQSRVLAAQVRRWARGDDDRFGPVAARVPAARRGRSGAVRAAEEAARTATAGFASWLEEVHAARGADRDAVGRDLYTVTSQAFLGTRLDLQETYEYGWDLLGRLTADGARLAARLGHDTIAAAEEHLDRSSLQVPVGEPLVRWAEDRLRAAAAVLDGTVLDVPGGRHTAVEVQLAAPGSGSIHYLPGDPSGGRPGRVMWSVPHGAASVPVWREVSTVHHEGVPGHHLQHAVTAATPGLHPWQRHLCHVHGYAEGWAHYVEGRADDWGLLRDDAERLGVVLAQRWRAARVVVDLGLHLQLPVPAGNGFTTATHWTPGSARDLLVSVTGMHPSTAAFEVDRYYGWPGQALAFSVGARLWDGARRRATAADPRSGTERAFHARALGLGPMGLDVLAEHLA